MYEKPLDDLIKFYSKHNPKRESKYDTIESKYRYRTNLLRDKFIHFGFFKGYTNYTDVDARNIVCLALDYFLFGEEIIGIRLKRLADDIEGRNRDLNYSGFKKILNSIGFKKLKNARSIFDYCREGDYIKKIYNGMNK